MAEEGESAIDLSLLGCSSCRAAGVAPRVEEGAEGKLSTVAVRFGFMKHVGEFVRPLDVTLAGNSHVVIRTQRGVEIGEQVAYTCSGCSKAITREQIQTYVEGTGPSAYATECGHILRVATPDDLREDARIRTETIEKRRTCQELADQHNLPMDVVECEHLFGGERVLFYFMAEGRVDFRALVRDLAQTYRTRIEMRQIGARDEARLLADYETCGRECCCKVFLKELKPVSMKMAKIQKSTLDPSKVSGRCGRLKCCLRYEHSSYQELDRTLPKVGVSISTRHGDGVVVNRQILTQLVQVRTPEGGAFAACLEDVYAPDGPAVREPVVEEPEKPEKPAPLPARRRPRRRPESKESSSAKPSTPAQSAPSSPKPKSPGETPDGAPSSQRRRRRSRRRKRPDTPGGGGKPSPPGPSPNA